MQALAKLTTVNVMGPMSPSGCSKKHVRLFRWNFGFISRFNEKCVLNTGGGGALDDHN